MPLMLWNIPTSTVSRCQRNPVIFPSWRKATSTTGASFTIERPLCLPLRKVEQLDVDPSRALVDRTPGFTMMLMVDETALTAVDLAPLFTGHHLVGQHLAKDYPPGLGVHMDSLHAHHLQSTTTMVNHTPIVLHIVTGTGTGIAIESGIETGTESADHLEVGRFLERGLIPTRTYRPTSANVWTAM